MRARACVRKPTAYIYELRRSISNPAVAVIVGTRRIILRPLGRRPQCIIAYVLSPVPHGRESVTLKGSARGFKSLSPPVNSVSQCSAAAAMIATEIRRESLKATKSVLESLNSAIADSLAHGKRWVMGHTGLSMRLMRGSHDLQPGWARQAGDSLPAAVRGNSRSRSSTQRIDFWEGVIIPTLEERVCY